ncbi:MAG: diacylglycerol kinase family protein [Bacteroidota bacterium]|nr:diacylglycerol kinase family protein [Bacteroidota bacterium]
MTRNYLFIVNPNAGNSKAGKDWRRIEKILQKREVKYKAMLTAQSGHALNIISEELQLGYKTIIVVGGDGTLNEVVNGIFHQNIVPPEQVNLGIIPVGTGNDWARYYKLPRNYNKALNRIFKHKTHFQDVGRVRYTYEGKENISYFVNIAGFGFDAEVVNRTNVIQERGNRAAITYLYSLLRCLFSYKAEELNLIINDKHIRQKVFSISIGNGKYSGGGMRQTPHAVINDGLLDVTVYDDMSVWKIVVNLPKLYNGRVKKLNTVSSYRSSKLAIFNENKPLFAEIDGELIKGTHFNVEILPSALRILL